nr:DUF3795 domain-containing protein [Anaerosporobacter faecicola]
MIESRCGIVCSKCEYRDQFSCKGCVNIEKPMWGECKIKKCCESKKITHCGLCEKFPCEDLITFSYDKEQGDHGARIEQCRCWYKGGDDSCQL